MRSVRLLHITLAALFLLALVLVPECTAAGDNKGASSSGTSITIDSLLPHQPFTFDQFSSKINLERIGKPISNFYAKVDFARDIPFDGNQPIITIHQDGRSRQMVEYALGRYGTVLLLDPARKALRKITYQNGRIEAIPWKSAEEMNSALASSEVDPDVHAVRRFLLSDDRDPDRLRQLPEPISTDHLPHYNDMPIIEPSESALGHMAYVYRENGPKKYWFWKQGEPTLVEGSALPKVPKQLEYNRLRAFATNFAAARLTYGDAMASLIHGHSFPLESEKAKSREYGPFLREYPRFGPAATRDEMIAALQKYGRVRYYNKHYSFTGPFKVKLRDMNARTVHANALDIQPLSGEELREEGLWAKVGRLKLPV